MTTRRKFLAGLMASAAAPALPKALPFQTVGVAGMVGVDYTAGLVASFRQTKEILGVNILNGSWAGRSA